MLTMAPPGTTALLERTRSEPLLGQGRSETDGRLLVFSELYPPDIGGSAVLLHEIYSRVHGPEVIVAADGRSHTTTNSDAGPRIVPVPIQSPNWGVLQVASLRHHLQLALAVRRLARGAPTVVHCGRALPEGLAASMARLLGGPRYCCWSHGEDVVSATTSRELTFLMRRVYSGAAAVFANSVNTRTLLMEARVDVRKIHIVYPGVDAQRFHPSVDGRTLRNTFAAANDVVMLSVGRLQRRKGHDMVINVMSLLGPLLPRLRYVIVGDGEERARLEELAGARGLSDRVTFLGKVSPEALPSCYAACDLFVLPNRVEHADVEGFGIVFLEAAASGKPTIGGSSGGVGEAVVDGKTGLLVGGADPLELARAIRNLVEDQDLRQRFGDAGRQRVEQSFTWEASARRVQAIHGAVIRDEL